MKTSNVFAFRLIRTCCSLALIAAFLVAAKLVNGYIFCGFNPNFFADVPAGVVLIVGYCVSPLLGLAIERETTTKFGLCCKIVGAVTVLIGFLYCFVAPCAIGILSPLALAPAVPLDNDPFNVCGNRTVKAVSAQFSNAMSTFELLQRLDVIFKLLIAVGWLLLYLYAPFVFYHFPEDSAKGPNQDENAAREADDQKKEAGIVDVGAENLRNEINEHDRSAKPEFSIVDVEKEATRTKATKEDSL